MAFEQPHSRGPVPKFCSPAHRQAAYRDRHEGVTLRERVVALETEVAAVREILSIAAPKENKGEQAR